MFPVSAALEAARHRSCDLEGKRARPLGDGGADPGAVGGSLTLRAPRPSLRGCLAGSRLVGDQSPGPGPAAPLGSADGNHRAVTHRQARKPGEPRAEGARRPVPLPPGAPSPSRPAGPTPGRGVQPSTPHMEMALASSPAYHPGPRGAEPGCRVAGGPLGAPQLRAQPCLHQGPRAAGTGAPTVCLEGRQVLEPPTPSSGSSSRQSRARSQRGGGWGWGALLRHRRGKGGRV